MNTRTLSKFAALLMLLALIGFFSPASFAAANSICDANSNSVVDKIDINLITAAVGKSSSGSDDPRDANHDGKITAIDARVCVNQCTLAKCATPQPVPNLVGLTQAAAQTAITGAGLTVGSITQQNSSSVPSGNVISQNPAAGASVAAGSAIALVVSSGPAPVSAPNVVGLTQAAAETAITNAGLTVGSITQQNSSSVPSGNVISQNPAAGASVAAGSAIALIVSSGSAPVSAPNVVGLTQAAAQTAITNAGLTVGSITQQNSSSVPSGNVISQNPAAGASVAAGSAIALVVSSGPAPVSAPNVVGLTQAAAQTAITNAGLTVGSITQQNSSSVPSGNVISQNPAAGASVAAGSAIALIVSSGPAPVSAPNVVGLTQAAAQTAITNAGLTVGSITQQNSSSVPSGNVISQNPAAGASVAAGSAIALVVSSGPAPVSAPNVVGLTQAAAQTAITNAGLTVGSITQQNSSSVPSGNVISQNPAAGASVAAGSAIALIVSSGPAPVSAPNVVGLTQAAAQTAITNAGLTVGSITQQNSSSVPSGNVISQNPAAGASVAAGSAIALVVSSGPAPVSAPNVVGLTQAAAQTAITNAGLTVGSITQQNSSSVPSGNVISQNPAAGASVAAGSAIALVVSSGPAPVLAPNVVGLSQAAAQSAITGAGLTVGTVTQQNSSTVALGSVISQNPAAGASVAAGSAIALVVSSGPVAALPTSMTLTLGQNVVNGGSILNFTEAYFDSNSNPFEPAPVADCAITAQPGSSGGLPTVDGNVVSTAIDSRGEFKLTCSVSNAALSANQSFVVIATAPQAQRSQQGLYSGFSGNLGSMTQTLNALPDAVANGQLADIALLSDQLVVAKNGVNLRDMSYSRAFAPEGGFPPTPAQLSAKGYNPVPDDATLANVITQLITKVSEITAFINGLDPLNLTDAQKTQYDLLRSQLQSLINQLAALQPSVRGVVSAAPNINHLLANILPVNMHALIDMTNQALQDNGLVAMSGNETPLSMLAGLQLPGAPAQAYTQTQPAFFGLVDLMLGNSLMGQLINTLYGDAFKHIENAMIILIGNDLLNSFLNNLHLEGIITGASLSFHIFHAPNSVIEGYNFNTNPVSNEVLLVGPDQINAARDIIDLLTNPPEINDLDDVWDLFEDVKEKVDAAGAAAETAFQTPSDVYYGCILDFGESASCQELAYNDGFTSVFTSGFNLPTPVLVLVHNLDTGTWAFDLFNFLKAANPEP